jgi:hypothetical protein
MKQQQQFRWPISIIPVMALIVFIPACATQTGNVASSDVQTALIQSGFKVRPATTHQQQEQLQRLPEHQFTVVKQKGENFYVWADKPSNRLFCGNEQAHRTYKEYRKAQRERESGAITWVEEPRGIPVTVFHGWAPFPAW